MKEMEELQELQNLASVIKTIGVPTGSRVWGLENGDSDYDYVILWQELRQLVPNFLDLVTRDDKTYKDPYLRAYRFSVDGVDFNVISVWNPKEIQIHRDATTLIAHLPLIMVEDKENRVDIFEVYKHVLRKTYPRKPSILGEKHDY